MPKNFRKDKSYFGNQVLSGALGSFTLLSGTVNQVAMANPPKDDGNKDNQKVIEGKEIKADEAKVNPKDDSSALVYLFKLVKDWIDRMRLTVVKIYKQMTGKDVVVQVQENNHGDKDILAQRFIVGPMEKVENFIKKEQRQKEENEKNAAFLKNVASKNVLAIKNNIAKIRENNTKIKQLDEKIGLCELPKDEHVGGVIVKLEDGYAAQVLSENVENVNADFLNEQNKFLEEQKELLEKQNSVMRIMEEKIKKYEEKKIQDQQLIEKNKKTISENVEQIDKNQKTLVELKKCLDQMMSKDSGIKLCENPRDEFHRLMKNINYSQEQKTEEIIESQKKVLQWQSALINKQEKEINKAKDMIKDERKKAEEKERLEKEKAQAKKIEEMEKKLKKLEEDKQKLQKQLEGNFGNFLVLEGVDNIPEDDNKNKDVKKFSVTVKFGKGGHEEVFNIAPNNDEQMSFSMLALIRAAQKVNGEVCVRNENDRKRFDELYKRAQDILDSAQEGNLTVETISSEKYSGEIQQFYKKYIGTLEKVDKVLKSKTVETFKLLLSYYVKLEEFYQKMNKDEEKRNNTNIVKNVLIFLNLKNASDKIEDQLFFKDLQKEFTTELKQEVKGLIDDFGRTIGLKYSVFGIEEQGQEHQGDENRVLNTLKILDDVEDTLKNYFDKFEKLEQEQQKINNESDEEILKRNFVLELGRSGSFYLAKDFEKVFVQRSGTWKEESHDFSMIPKALSYAIMLYDEYKNDGYKVDFRLGVEGNGSKKATQVASDVMFEGESLLCIIKSSFDFLSEQKDPLCSDDKDDFRVKNKALWEVFLGQVGDNQQHIEEINKIMFWIDKAKFTLKKVSELLKNIDKNENKKNFQICAVLFSECYNKAQEYCKKVDSFRDLVNQVFCDLLNIEEKTWKDHKNYLGEFINIHNYNRLWREVGKVGDKAVDKVKFVVRRGDVFPDEYLDVREEYNIFNQGSMDDKTEEKDKQQIVGNQFFNINEVDNE